MTLLSPVDDSVFILYESSALSSQMEATERSQFMFLTNTAQRAACTLSAGETQGLFNYPRLEVTKCRCIVRPALTVS